jgi:hypothetical protein
MSRGFQDARRQGARPLFGVVALMLIIAIVNLARLMIAQTAPRQRELTLRAAVGRHSGSPGPPTADRSRGARRGGHLLGTLLAFGQSPGKRELAACANLGQSFREYRRKTRLNLRSNEPRLVEIHEMRFVFGPEAGEFHTDQVR